MKYNHAQYGGPQVKDAIDFARLMKSKISNTQFLDQGKKGQALTLIDSILTFNNHTPVGIAIVEKRKLHVFEEQIEDNRRKGLVMDGDIAKQRENGASHHHPTHSARLFYPSQAQAAPKPSQPASQPTNRAFYQVPETEKASENEAWKLGQKGLDILMGKIMVPDSGQGILAMNRMRLKTLSMYARTGTTDPTNSRALKDLIEQIVPSETSQKLPPEQAEMKERITKLINNAFVSVSVKNELNEFRQMINNNDIAGDGFWGSLKVVLNTTESKLKIAQGGLDQRRHSLISKVHFLHDVLIELSYGSYGISHAFQGDTSQWRKDLVTISNSIFSADSGALRDLERDFIVLERICAPILLKYDIPYKAVSAKQDVSQSVFAHEDEILELKRRMGIIYPQVALLEREKLYEYYNNELGNLLSRAVPSDVFNAIQEYVTGLEKANNTGDHEW